MRLIAIACVLAACPAPTAKPVAPAPPPAPVVPPSNDDEAITAAVLARFVTNPWTMPDAGRLPSSGQVFVATEIADGRVLGPGALPPSARRPFVGKPTAELQAEADRTHAAVAFIRVFAIDISGPHAQVMVGVDTAAPAGATDARPKTCVTLDNYEQVDIRMWAFARHVGATCMNR